MFGGYCWMLRGNMLCGVEVGRYMFRVGRDLEAEALGRPGASPMDITGKPMRGFVWVRAENVACLQSELAPLRSGVDRLTADIDLVVDLAPDAASRRPTIDIFTVPPIPFEDLWRSVSEHNQ